MSDIHEDTKLRTAVEGSTLSLKDDRSVSIYDPRQSHEVRFTDIRELRKAIEALHKAGVERWNWSEGAKK